jgi:surface carbohydrate biosynthesis protein
MLQPIVYLTCELKGRDLDSRALIGAHLVKMGYTVVLGQYWNLMDNAPTAPRGCYFFKTSNQVQARGMKLCKYFGHAVVASDEEAITLPESLSATATDGATFEVCDLFLALNEGHKRALLKAFRSAVGKVRVAGTARADILRAVDYPNPHQAPYILFNTSFGVLNSIWKSLDLALRAYRKGISRLIPTDEQERIIQSRIDYERAALHETKALLEWLVRRNDIDIILRPHPGEDAGFWHIANAGRLKVIEKSDAYPWTQHAKLMIHSDSTTGVEAALMGVSCVNLSPVDSWAERLTLRDINYSSRSAVEAQSAIAEFLATGKGPIASASFNDPFPLSSGEKIAGAMIPFLPAPQPVPSFSWSDTSRNDPQKEKFTVSLEEFLVSMRQASNLARVSAYEVSQIADSVALVRPEIN